MLRRRKWGALPRTRRAVLAARASLPGNCRPSVMSGASPVGMLTHVRHGGFEQHLSLVVPLLLHEVSHMAPHGSALNVQMLTAMPSSVRCGGSQGG